MTDSMERPSDSRWQTLAGRAFLLVLTVLIGRWAAGATFGYVLFVAAWGPIAAVLLIHIGQWNATCSRLAYSPFPLPRTASMLAGYTWQPCSLVQPILITAGTALLMALPIFMGWPIRVALSLALVLLILHACTVAVALLTGRLFGQILGQAIAIILWLTWLILPMTATDTVSQHVSESILSEILAVHPVLVLNQLDSTAGDWSHQAVAYRWLTRLGQDLPFDWPGHVWPFLEIHGAVAIIGFGIVGLRMFHVEHSQAID